MYLKFLIGQFKHLYHCVVHDPIPVYLNPKDFNKVTEESKSFWKEGVDVGGSICKKCYWKFEHRKKSEEESADTLPNDSNVWICLSDSFLEPPATSTWNSEHSKTRLGNISKNSSKESKLGDDLGYINGSKCN